MMYNGCANYTKYRKLLALEPSPLSHTEGKIALKAALFALGCKVNSYETERIREDMVSAGFEIVDFSEKADVYIVNTCSVTNIADRKSRQMLHKAKTMNPSALIVATGCYVQTAEKDEKLLEAADILIGNNHKSDIVKKILERLDQIHKVDATGINGSDDIADTKNAEDIELSKRITAANGSSTYIQPLIDDIACENSVEDLSITDYPERSRAFVRIEDGCNQFCTYCIIPYARGRVRSREKDEILEEIRSLADKGFKEVVITGIHLSSFGIKNYENDLKKNEWNYKPLLDLIQETGKIKGIERIRLGSLEPRIICKEFIDGLKSVESFCPHFHLSLQSGCDTVLKRMNRHYSAEEFLEKCELLRSCFDRPAITTDVIVGFPQETDEEFAKTEKMLEKAAFSKMHIFKYSRRKGTVADRMPGQLTESVKHERAVKLQELDNRMHKSYAESFIGQEVRVLIEEENDEYMEGLTERYLSVRIKKQDGSCENINTFRTVKVLSVTDDGVLCPVSG